MASFLDLLPRELLCELNSRIYFVLPPPPPIESRKDGNFVCLVVDKKITTKISQDIFINRWDGGDLCYLIWRRTLCLWCGAVNVNAAMDKYDMGMCMVCTFPGLSNRFTEMCNVFYPVRVPTVDGWMDRMRDIATHFGRPLLWDREEIDDDATLRSRRPDGVDDP